MPERPQVGALCWRRDGEHRRVLLVTSRDTRRWVIPKGNRMAGRSDPEAAAQEAVEEAGVHGVVSSARLGSYSYEKGLKAGGVRRAVVGVYSLEVLIQLGAWPEGHERDRRWMTVEDAVAAVDEPGLKAILMQWERDGERGSQGGDQAATASAPVRKGRP